MRLLRVSWSKALWAFRIQIQSPSGQGTGILPELYAFIFRPQAQLCWVAFWTVGSFQTIFKDSLWDIIVVITCSYLFIVFLQSDLGTIGRAVQHLYMGGGETTYLQISIHGFIYPHIWWRSLSACTLTYTPSGEEESSATLRVAICHNQKKRIRHPKM